MIPRSTHHYTPQRESRTVHNDAEAFVLESAKTLTQKPPVLVPAPEATSTDSGTIKE